MDDVHHENQALPADITVSPRVLVLGQGGDAMAIRCICPNGHVLKVKESFAGTIGLCPVCRAKVKVPTLCNQKVSEEAVMAMLGPCEIKENVAAALKDEEEQKILEANLRSGIFGRGTIVKNCSRCNEEISADTHICPHCHTYVG
jgi:hypothetical protein